MVWAWLFYDAIRVMEYVSGFKYYLRKWIFLKILESKDQEKYFYLCGLAQDYNNLLKSESNRSQQIKNLNEDDIKNLFLIFICQVSLVKMKIENHTRSIYKWINDGRQRLCY
jgi:hypothetical protein